MAVLSRLHEGKEGKWICKGWKRCKFSPYVNGRTSGPGGVCCGFMPKNGFISTRPECNSRKLTEKIEFAVKLKLAF